MLHKDLIPAERHAVHAWEVTNEAARNALVVTANDIGKICKIDSPAAYHILMNNIGPIWIDITGAGGGGSSGKTVLTADTTYYIATTGNDTTGNGSSGAPWATINKACNYIRANIEALDFAITIQLADGTYNLTTPAVIRYLTATVIIRGNVATPANVVVHNATGTVLDIQHCSSVTVQGMKLTNATSGYLLSGMNSIINIGDLEFGASSGIHIYLWQRAVLDVIANYTISAGTTVHMYIGEHSVVRCFSRTITVTGTPAFSSGFVWCIRNSFGTWLSSTFSGGATGTRYQGQTSSHIQVTSASATFFPGNASGVLSGNAVYTA